MHKTSEVGSRGAAASDGLPVAADRGQVLLDLSNAVVRIHKEFYGKGPTKARSYLSNDLLIVLLEGGLTRSEQTLHERGYDEEVLHSRMALQSAVESELKEAIESILHRPVRSFMSANDLGNSLQAEIFVLYPDGSPEAHNGDLVGRAQRAREQHREILEEHRALRAEHLQSRSAFNDGKGDGARPSRPEDA